MKYTKADGTITAYFSGHIDSANAGEIEKEFFELVDAESFSNVIIDAGELEYISSAGLRIILKLRHRFSDIKVINVSTSVYEILEMTGFTELLTVEKALRNYDVTGCEIIGSGANGTVYRIDRDTIVKVYRKATSLDVIKNERDLSRTAFIMGIPTAIPYDVVRVGDLYGSVFELLNAKSLDELMIESEENLDFAAEKTASMAKIIHSTKAPENLPSQKKVAESWLPAVEGFLPAAVYQKLSSLMHDIPDTDTMIHGDLHIKNIMLQNGETLLIDMDTLSSGHPIFELAFIFNAYKGFGIVDSRDVSGFLGISFDCTGRLLRKIFELYLETDDDNRITEVEEKASIIGYLRIMSRVFRKKLDDTEKGIRMIEACKAKLEDLLECYDTLDF